MNELPPSSDNTPRPNPVPQQAESPVVSPAARRGPARLGQGLIYLVLIVLALLLAAEWWKSRTDISTLRKEVAQRLQSGDSVNTETKVLVKSMQDGMKELQAKVNVLESRQVEAQSQQLALEQLYQDLSKNRDD